MDKKILLLDTLHESFITGITAVGFNCVEAYTWSKEKIIEALPDFTGMVIRSRIPADKELLLGATRLKFIARVGAGMENIDVPFAESKNIICLNAPQGNRMAVAEHCLAMLLALFNNLMRADKEVRKGIWRREENRGVELTGKTIAIIGYGYMGSAFAEVLKGFDVRLLVYDKYKEVVTDKSKNLFATTLPEIFGQADIVSLHVPLTEETKFMLNDKFINSFKKNIYLLNTSRGKCLKTDDLVKNLKTGKIIGACLDVLEYETSSFENIPVENLPPSFKFLSEADNVILTPHIAGWTHESNRKMADVLVEKIKKLNL